VTKPQYEVGISAGGKDQVETVLEIRLGKGVMPEGVNSYPAKN
jgi:methyl coenzyme M reductase alpha subunit